MSMQPTSLPPIPPALQPNLYLGRIRDIVYKVAGIFQPDTKLGFLQDRCARRMSALGITSLQDYCERLTLHPDRQTELHLLLNEITVGETCFFRHQPQLEAFRQVVLPEAMKNRERLGLKQLRIWSAGCSTGEEPYTLAMILLEESRAMLRGWNWSIVATDLNDRSIAHAKQGVYSEYSLRNMPAPMRDRYFRKEGSRFHINETVTSSISFSRVNLLDDYKMLFQKGMDIIFCCNVLIYFDGSSKRRVIRHFYSNLVAGGFLFLGHSESLFNVTDDFKLVQFPGATGYSKPNGEGASR